MNRFVHGTTVALLLTAVTMAETTQEQCQAETIALDRVWAFRMPGTRDIRELVSDSSVEGLWPQIVKTLLADVSPDWPIEGKRARSGFAVAGDGHEALQRVYSVLVEGKQPQDSFRSDQKVALVFFSHQFGSYVHLQEVIHADNMLRVKYRLVRPVNKTLPAHLAMVPVGELPAGEYKVETVQLPTGQELLDRSFSTPGCGQTVSESDSRLGHRFVSQPFKFQVVRRGHE